MGRQLNRPVLGCGGLIFSMAGGGCKARGKILHYPHPQVIECFSKITNAIGMKSLSPEGPAVVMAVIIWPIPFSVFVCLLGWSVYIL